MFSSSELTTCMSDLVGYRQSANPCYAALSSALKLSTSGFYVNDLPGIDFDIITDIYANTEYASVSDYLTAVHSSERHNLFSNFVNRLKQKIESKELLSNFPVVSGVIAQANLVTQNARFVGYRINPVMSNNLRTQITYIGVQINEVLAQPLKIYLYCTDQLLPIKTFSLSNTQTFSLEWQAVTDWFADFQSSNYGSGQHYLLGYYEYDPANPQAGQLSNTAKAYYLPFDCNCGSSAKRKWSQYVGIEPIELNNDLLNWDNTLGEYTLPDSGTYATDYVTNQTYGLVFKVNVTCDITPILCANKNMFGKPLQYMIAYKILMDAFNSSNVNRRAEKKEQFKLMAGKYAAELYGYTDENQIYHKGILDNLTIDLSNLDSYCLPCKQTQPFTGRIIRNVSRGGCLGC